MITEVKKIKEGEFLINESVKVYELDIIDTGIEYSFDYDEKVLTEQEAQELSEEFINAAIQTAVAKREDEEENAGCDIEPTEEEKNILKNMGRLK